MVKVGEHFGRVPILVADDFAGDFAVTVDDVGLGDHHGAVGFGDAGAVFFCGGIAICRIADGVFEQEFFVGGVVFIGGDTEDDRVVGGDVLLEAIKAGGFFNAGLAPGAPEIQDDDLAPEIGEVSGFTVERERKIAGFGAGDRGFALA